MTRGNEIKWTELGVGKMCREHVWGTCVGNMCREHV